MKKRKTALSVLLLAALLLTACSRPAAQPTAQPAAEAGESADGKTEYAAPATAEELQRGVFDVVNSFHPGTAGSSLSRANAAAELLQFVKDYELLHAEREALAQNLRTAWEALPEEEKGTFRENFPGLGELIQELYDEPETVTGLFEDAGVGERIQLLRDTPQLREGWEVLNSLAGELR